MSLLFYRLQPSLFLAPLDFHCFPRRNLQFGFPPPRKTKMEKLRSISSKEGRPRSEGIVNINNAPRSMQDLRCYTTSCASQCMQEFQIYDPKKTECNANRKYKQKKGFTSSCFSSTEWSLSDAELLRKTRISTYKIYGVEAKMKGSLRKSFRWIKHACSQVVYGCW